ncbi:MAG: hypothetical protein GY727_09215 [Gammaproteobacteria bacterium]|nr:hypothetical protein [Gammaproteobacteria bacterium]MCP4089529.1 hypothetical protein [Gammaproteobacteria bacterium]
MLLFISSPAFSEGIGVYVPENDDNKLPAPTQEVFIVAVLEGAKAGMLTVCDKVSEAGAAVLGKIAMPLVGNLPE